MTKPQLLATEFTELELPLLPLRDVVIYPHMVISLFVGRQSSVAALQQAMASDKKIMLLTQKNAAEDEPSQEQLFEVGTVANILQLLKLSDGTIKVLVEGIDRAKLVELNQDEYFMARVQTLSSQSPEANESLVMHKALLAHFSSYAKLSKKISNDVLDSLQKVEEIERLVDSTCSHLPFTLDEKQKILEILDVKERLNYLLGLMDNEIDLLQIENKIRSRVKKQMEKSQREYYLNEQIKAIQKELGDEEEAVNEYDEIKKKIQSSGMSKEAGEKALTELNKLKLMPAMSAEATVVRSYIDWMLNVPWKKRSKVRHDLKRAQSILEDDHYGLEEVKERILEYLAVQKRVGKLKGPVLCLVGPPGVGKTSLGESIARATNRKYVRMALGGMRDEAEIRGHRRTYIGAMPGKILQKLAKSGVKNPLFLLDELDKLGSDMRGDPASALLEVLDPEQNNAFNDHYLEVDYDLSDVMFVCTSNTMNIPEPLLDRMEVIRIPGYTEDEKMNIANRYLVPKQKKLAGLKEKELNFDESSVLDLIRYYTREAGVRGLEREIAKVARKVVKEQALEPVKQEGVKIDSAQLSEYSGVRRFAYGLAGHKNQIGQVTGLAWTQFGGELLTIEAATLLGKGGKVITTGSLGDVMQESIQAALTVVRSRAQAFGIEADFHERQDLHIHVPEGATPKDGPSAGIGMCTAIVSVLTGIAVRCDIAMTGEITLRGQILGIGGLKEKLLAAHRGGIKTVLIPEENEKDLKEIPDKIKQNLEIIRVKWIDEVLQLALEYPLALRLEGELVEDKRVGKAGKLKSEIKKSLIKAH